MRWMDNHWQEVVNLAKKYGFIVRAAGGTAIIVTHENQVKHYGRKEYERIQKMNGRLPEVE